MPAAATLTGVARARMRLRDGSTVVVRPIAQEDARLIVEAFERLGPVSRYRRFLTSLSRLSERTLALLVDVDHRDREALLALDAVTGEPLAVARYGRLADDPGAAEVAVAVVDHAQGNGLGSGLMHRLVERARQEGIERVTALVLADNRPVFALVRGLGTPTTRYAGSGTVEVMVRLPPSDEDMGSGVRGWLRAAASEQVEFSLSARRSE